LFKMVDKLLQGEKFSTSLGKGLGTAATAFAAGQVGQAMQGGDQAMDAGQAVDWMSKDPNFGPRINEILNSPDRDETWKEIFKKQVNLWGGSVQPGSDPSGAARAIQNAIKVADAKAGMTESQIRRIFYTAARIQQLNEGVWDKVKGATANAAGAVATGAAKNLVDKTKSLGTTIANKAQTVGTNLTPTVTADKLMTAWKKAGSPTDSDAVAAIMKQAGVDDGIIASTMKAQGNQAAAAPGATPADAATAAPVDAQTQKFIQQLVASYAALTEPEKAQLKKELEDAVTASDVGSNVVKGTMESRRRKKRSV